VKENPVWWIGECGEQDENGRSGAEVHLERIGIPLKINLIAYLCRNDSFGYRNFILQYPL